MTLNNNIRFENFLDLKRKEGLFLLLSLCVVSRILTSIYYIADPDSLRFALCISNYDITKLQPHFPGYPVFCFFAKVLNVFINNYPVTFSAIGGVSVFILCYSLLKIKRHFSISGPDWILAGLIFLNPFFWIMSNRYMPDMLGLAVCALASYFYIEGKFKTSANIIFIALVGLLAGIRLSFLPLFIIPVLQSIIYRPGPLKQILCGLTVVTLWLTPMIIDTGWEQLVTAAKTQTDGHFNEWGGTMNTAPEFSTRASGFIEGINAVGLSGFWPGRNWLTIVLNVIIIIAVCSSIKKLLIKKEGTIIIFISLVLYGMWAFLYQNIIYSPRHILPLLPPLILLISTGLTVLAEFKKVFYLLSALLLVFYGVSCILQLKQHLQPVSIAQTSNYLKKHINQKDAIISTGLVNYYLAGTGVKANFFNADSHEAYVTLPENRDGIYVIGNLNLFPGKKPVLDTTFYHNPYVNKIWSEIRLKKYQF